MSYLFPNKNKITIEDEVKLEIAEIEKYFSDKHLIAFVQKYEAIMAKKKDSHSFSFWGINFENESVLSVKFYASIFEEMTKEEICQFIPVSEDYIEFIDLKSKGTSLSKENIGTVLEIKFKTTSNKVPTYGFFYMLKNIEDSYNKIGYPVYLPKEFKKSGVSLGINFEYAENRKYFKKYYYYDTPEDKLFFERKFKMKILGDIFEYAEGDGISKLNNSGRISDFEERDKEFSSKERSIIKHLCHKYDMRVISYGAYEKKSIKAIYFRNKILQNNIQEKYTDTIFRQLPIQC